MENNKNNIDNNENNKDPNVQEENNKLNNKISSQLKPRIKINDFSIENMHSVEITKSRIDKQNNIQIEDSQLDFVSIDQSYITKPENRIFDDICSVCSRKIFFIKFICAICNQCTLCDICEEFHLHPLLKFKQNELSTLEDVVHYIKQHQMKAEHPTRLFDTLFKDKFIFQLESISHQFTMRKKQKIKLPVSIENTMNCEVSQREVGLVFVAKNIKDLMISCFPVKNSFGRKEKFTSFIDISSGAFPKLYDFTLELYSTTGIILESNKLNLKIEINDDEEDEKLNVYFEDCIQVRFLDKEKKRKIREVILQKIGIDNPILIKNILEENDWNTEVASKQISLIHSNSL